MIEFVHNVLGTDYDVKLGSRAELEMPIEYCGLCKEYTKEILVCNDKENGISDREMRERVKEILAHEIFHAYLNEAGLVINHEDEERLCDFYMKNWRKLTNSMKEIVMEVSMKMESFDKSE